MSSLSVTVAPVPLTVRLACRSRLVPSLAEAVTFAPAGVRSVKRSVPDLRRVFSDTVLATVTDSSAARPRRGVGSV